MKKMMIYFVLLFILVGCSKENANVSVFKHMVSELYNYEYYMDGSENFDVEYNVTKITDGAYRYDIIINNPKIEMLKIRAIAMSDLEESTLYPSIGYEEGVNYNMDPNIVDKTNYYYKGFQLAGTIDNPNTIIKLYVEYVNDNNLISEYILLGVEK